MANTLIDVGQTLNQVQNAVSGAGQVLGSLSGAIPTSNAPSNQLPTNAIPSFRTGTVVRDIIHWFVPQIGTVSMYVNPANINYRYKKLITKERTKGGYTLQYWGEDLTTLTISGTTGSSGIEGINVLEEIYRGEQYSFDAVGQSLLATSAATGANNQIASGIAGALSQNSGSTVSNGSIGGLLGSGIAQGVFGSGVFTALAPRNIPSLAQLAFSVQMFYSGNIWRGFFESFSVVESATNIGLFEYTLEFTATQKQGIRQNTYPWQRSATSGVSDNEQAGGIPLSWATLANQ